IAIFLFYGIPLMINSSSYLLIITSSSSNITSYCTTYTTSIYHPLWMVYTEIGLIYSIPLLFNFIGLLFLLHNLCQKRPRGLDAIERKHYVEKKKMTWHVIVLSLTFICLWLPWITIRILIIFDNTKQIQRALQIAYYVLILKSVLFPILYAATNSSFRGSFAIYKHKRITINNRVWTFIPFNEELIEFNSGSSIDGDGCVHVRERVDSPLPHDFVHVDQSDHEENPPST
ncbi:unnamed protein product, partial [Adineta steineri]